MGLGPTEIPLNFESDLDHSLDTKNNPDFLIYLLHAFGKVCALQVLSFNLELPESVFPKYT